MEGGGGRGGRSGGGVDEWMSAGMEGYVAEYAD